MSSSPSPSSPPQFDDVQQQYFEQWADRSNPDRFVVFAEHMLGLRLANTQKRILRAVAQNQYVLIQSGNGVGKSFVVAALNLAFLLARQDAIVFCTSGSYQTLEDTIWRPMEQLHRQSNLPGSRKRSPPRIEDLPNEKSFFRAIAPKHPESLEGRHAANMLVVVEEADKPDVGIDHITSAESSITDENDRMVVICNPPEDETNVVYELAESDRYAVVQFDSFESHNVLLDAGRLPADEPQEPIHGLADLETIKQDWESWNNEEWPGFEQARTAHRERDDLDARWYRKRGGVMPPANAAVHRPLYKRHVDAATSRYEELSADEQASITAFRAGIGVDIGHEGGDRTAIVEVRDDVLDVFCVEVVDHHDRNHGLIENAIEAAVLTGQCAIDAVGEGSGPADWATARYDAAFRFKANSTPEQPAEYFDKKSEAYARLGQFLRDGGMIADDRLHDELVAAARAMQFRERTRAGNTVLVTDKQPVKDRLDRSPDLLDAASMAVWASTVEDPATVGQPRTRVFQTARW